VQRERIERGGGEMCLDVSMKVVIYGNGRIGQHWRKVVGEDRVAAVVDVVAPAGVDAKWASELTAEVARGAQGAIVCTPTGLHKRHVLECLALGLHVLCEKPLSMVADEIADCFDAAERAGKRLVVGLNRRWDALLAKVPRCRPGGTVSIACRDFPEPGEGYLASSGSVFHDCLIHEVDLALHRTGLTLDADARVWIHAHDNPPLPSSAWLRSGTVGVETRDGQTLIMTFSRQSDGYVHSMCVDGQTFGTPSRPGDTFMARFEGAFELLWATFAKVMQGAALSAAEEFTVPTRAECLTVCAFLDRLDAAYAASTAKAVKPAVTWAVSA